MKTKFFNLKNGYYFSLSSFGMYINLSSIILSLQIPVLKSILFHLNLGSLKMVQIFKNNKNSKYQTKDFLPRDFREILFNKCTDKHKKTPKKFPSFSCYFTSFFLFFHSTSLVLEFSYLEGWHVSIQVLSNLDKVCLLIEN